MKTITVKEIHNDFKSQVQVEKSFEKVDLSSMGFNDHANDLAGYYQQNYPGNKFITHDAVIELCNKYGLLLGPSKSFEGYIPTKNKKEISAFKLKDADKTKRKIVRVTNPQAITGFTNLDGSPFNALNEVFTLAYDNLGSPMVSGGPISQWLLNESDFEVIQEIELNNRFLVVANIEDFNMENMLVEGVEIKENIPPDPIVLCEVNGGYLIVTAWGEEASDENVLNANHN